MIENLNPVLDEFFSKLKVLVIDSKDLAEYATRMNKVHLGPSKTLVPRSSKFIIKNKYEHWGIWDTELCGDVKEPLSVSFDEKTETGLSLFLCCVMRFYHQDLLFMNPKEKPIKEFMGSRYAYNYRIVGNMLKFKNWLEGTDND